jgi:hypothetical protein
MICMIVFDFQTCVIPGEAACTDERLGKLAPTPLLAAAIWKLGHMYADVSIRSNVQA